MTTVAALSLNGVIAVCADGRETYDNDISEERRAKIWELPGGGLIALAGDSRTRNLFDLKVLPKIDDRSTAHDIAGAFKEAMDAEGYGKSDDIGSRCYGFGGIVVIGSVIWQISNDLHTDTVRERWPQALGSGERFAIGAMEAMLALGVPGTADEIVRLAVWAAMRRDSGSGGSVMLALRGAIVDGPRWLDV